MMVMMIGREGEGLYRERGSIDTGKREGVEGEKEGGREQRERMKKEFLKAIFRCGLPKCNSSSVCFSLICRNHNWFCAS